MELTKDAETAIQAIVSLGGRPLIVGGAVRDAQLGITSKDIDIEVHGEVSWLQLTEALAELGRVGTVGASFGVIKFGRDVDISFPRRDSKVRGGHTGFMIDVDPSMTVDEALSRRDFTMNAIALDPTTGEIIDPFGGVQDIHDRIIRHTSDAFVEDPLRVMRAVQFAGRFEFSIASETGFLCESLVDQFSELSVERIWAEWEKILSKGTSMLAVTRALKQTGWAVHFPGWEGDSMHTDVVLNRLKLDGQTVSSAERTAIAIAAQFLRRTTALERFLLQIDAPIWLRRSSLALATDLKVDGTTAQQVRVMSRRLDKSGVSLAHYLRVRGSDRTGFWNEAAAEQCLIDPDPPLLTGEDLKAFGLEPGPEFGVILHKALVAQDLDGWVSKGDAFAWFHELSPVAT